MTRPQENSEHLWTLIRADVDGSLTDGETAELEQLLSADDRSARAYLDYLHLHADLALWHRESHSFAKSLALVASAIEADGSGDQSTSERRTQSPTTETPTTERSATRVQRLRKWLVHHPRTSALSVAVLVIVAALVTASNIFVSPRTSEPGKHVAESPEFKDAEFIAWYMGGRDIKWLDGTKPEKTKLMPGQRLAIAKGLIEIQYRTRAVVVIEGPAEFFVGARDSGLGTKENIAQGSAPSPQLLDPKSLTNSGYLALGKLVARVEGKKAKGFTINTPTGRVEDHGTEFGVEVLSSGAEEFVVLAGKVDVVREANGTHSAQRIRLTKNQGAFVAAIGGAIARRKKIDAQFVSAMRSRLDEALPVQSSGAVVSIDFDLDGGDFTVSGEPNNHTGHEVAGQVGRWQSLGAGSIHVEMTETRSMNTGGGVFTFNPGAAKTYQAYGANGDRLRGDGLFLTSDAKSNSIGWRLTGLASGESYDLILFGQQQKGNPVNPADFSITGHDAGNGVGQPVTLDTENDGNFRAVEADAKGTICGTFSVPNGQTLASWSGLQFRSAATRSIPDSTSPELERTSP